MRHMKRKARDESICEYLKTFHRGYENRIVGEDLQAALHVMYSTLHNAIHRLRCDGYPICSCISGYFYASRPVEIRMTIKHLESRAREITEARNGMTRSYSRIHDSVTRNASTRRHSRKESQICSDCSI